MSCPVGRSTGARFEVERPKNHSVVRSQFGARRFAYNWALGKVKVDLRAKKQGPEHEPVRWAPGALQKRWNPEYVIGLSALTRLEEDDLVCGLQLCEEWDEL